MRRAWKMASRCDSDSSRGRQTAICAVPPAGSAKGSHSASCAVMRGSTCRRTEWSAVKYLSRVGLNALTYPNLPYPTLTLPSIIIQGAVCFVQQPNLQRTRLRCQSTIACAAWQTLATHLGQRGRGQVVHDILFPVAARERAVHARELREVCAGVRAQRLAPRHLLPSRIADSIIQYILLKLG